MTTRFRAELVPDEPLVQDADYRFDDVDRAYIDDQIRACQEQLAALLLNSVVATWVRLDGSSDPLVPGDCVCLAPTDAGFAAVTKALPASLAAAGAVFGIALLAVPPGGRALIALRGVLRPAVTGVGAQNVANRFIRCSATARCERVTKFVANDFPVGTAAPSGFVNLVPLPQIVA